MQHGAPDGSATGFMCPRCGGALWEEGAGATLRFVCRIGDAFEAVELWVAHAATRNTALLTARRSLAENAALARKLAAWGNERGDRALAARLEAEAIHEESYEAQVRAMLDGLPDGSHLDDGSRE